ncbi:MAG: hypothetical protein ACR2PZ_08295 [Pseudomonadales bacterium]
MSMNSKPLMVVALGGNALSPPDAESSYAIERRIIADTALELQQLIGAGYRLLIVHGNGPQVGRLMGSDVGGHNLDVYVSQTQGELGYLLVQSLRRLGELESVGVVTRTLVSAEDAGLAQPTKAVGPILAKQPGAASRQVGTGWRLLVGSPRPLQILELQAIRSLLGSQHVVAGGGGGVPVTAAGDAVQGVVDKDWVAALLAVELGAEHLIFVTDVAGVFSGFGSSQQALVRQLSCEQADALAAQDAFGEGSMAPKIESAVRFARELKRPAHIVGLGSIMQALRNGSGTQIRP